MLQYPLLFRVQANASAGIGGAWNALVSSPSHQLPPVVCAIPPEFSGPGNGFSPEDLYAMALLNCFIATFRVMAEHSKLNFSDLGGQAVLEVDRNSSGVPWMARIRLTLRLSGTDDEAKAKRLLEKAAKSSMILNSVKTEIAFDFVVDSVVQRSATDPTTSLPPI